VAVKLLLSWDILPGREQDYFEFVVQEWIPKVQKLGLEPSDAWFTVYGDQPQILASANVKDLHTLRQALSSSEWDTLTARLLDYVENLQVKTVYAKPGFQM
jgi:hypothetical protein